MSELRVNNSTLAEELSSSKTQNATEGTVWNDPKSLTGNCERPSKCAEVSPPCKESSSRPTMAAFSALLAERDDYKNCCGTLSADSQYILELAAEAIKLREKLAKREKDDAMSETTPKGRRKRATAANKRVAVLKTKLFCVKILHSQLVEMATGSETDSNRARTDLRDAQVRLAEVEQKAKLARAGLNKVRAQSAGSAKAAEESSRLLTEVPTRAWSLEAEVKSLKSHMSEVSKVRDDAISSANERCRDPRMLDSSISLLKDEPDLLKRKETTRCDLEILGCKVADA